MARAHHDRRTPGDWLRGLFRQPPPGFYSRPADGAGAVFAHRFFR